MPPDSPQNQQEVNKYLTFLYPHYCHSELKKKKEELKHLYSQINYHKIPNSTLTQYP